MKHAKTFGCGLAVLTLVAALLPVAAQERGKVELSTGAGKITVSYGRPQLKGLDPLTWQKDGAYWRMGSNDMTTLTTPAELAFGSVRVPKGTYGLWLLKVTNERYELVFNSATAGMGMTHDKAKDVATVLLKKEAADPAVETFTIELPGSAGNGIFVMKWGTVRLSAAFTSAK